MTMFEEAKILKDWAIAIDSKYHALNLAETWIYVKGTSDIKLISYIQWPKST